MRSYRRQQGVVFLLALLMAHPLEVAAIAAGLTVLNESVNLVDSSIKLYHDAVGGQPASVEKKPSVSAN